jgi:hypothetical protein
MRRPALLALAAALLLPALPAAPAHAAQYSDTAAKEIASPALASPRPGVVEVFTRASGGGLQRRVQDDAGRWSSPQPLGGALTSKPAAVSMSAGRTDVFARGGQGQLVHRYALDGRWSAWTHLGGSITGAPAVASWAPGRLDVFARGTDGRCSTVVRGRALVRRGSASGGSLASAPPAVSTGRGGSTSSPAAPTARCSTRLPRAAGRGARSAASCTRARRGATGDGGDRRLRARRRRRPAAEVALPARGLVGLHRLPGAVASGPGCASSPRRASRSCPRAARRALPVRRAGRRRVVRLVLPGRADLLPRSWGLRSTSRYASLSRDARARRPPRRAGCVPSTADLPLQPSSFDMTPEAAVGVRAARARHARRRLVPPGSTAT